MITKITGKVSQVTPTELSLAVGPLEYEVLIPEFVRRQLQTSLGQDVTLFTIEYLEGNPTQGKLIPRMIGFLSDLERQFFDLICTVDGLGVKKALRAMVRPVREIAEAIEQQDSRALSALPGIGEATAERIIAKLRRKVPQFALMVARQAAAGESGPQRTLIDEAFDVLQAVGHTPTEARKMLESIMQTKKKFKDVQDILGAIYQQQHQG